jgi:hypothetical protein
MHAGCHIDSARRSLGCSVFFPFTLAGEGKRERLAAVVSNSPSCDRAPAAKYFKGEIVVGKDLMVA